MPKNNDGFVEDDGFMEDGFIPDSSPVSMAKDPYGRPLSRPEVIREEYPSETFGRYAEPIAQFGGAGAKKAPMGAALAGAATMGTEIVKQGIQAYNSEPGTPATTLEALRRNAMAFGRGAAGEALGRGVFAGAGAMAEKAAPGVKQTLAKIMKVSTGMPEREGMALINDTKIIARAKSAREAGKDFGAALTVKDPLPRANLLPKGIQEFADVPAPLKSGAEGARLAFGKSHLTADAAADKFDEFLPKLTDNTLDLQSAFSLRQLTMDKISDLPYNERSMKRLLSGNIDKLDSYIEAKLPDWSGAKTAYREAKVAEEFNNWLPLNKNLSPNVLRATAAVGAAAYGAREGDPRAIMALSLVSPRVWGGAIRGGGVIGRAASSPVGNFVTKQMTRLGTQYVAGQAIPSSTEELMRKHYEAQR